MNSDKIKNNTHISGLLTHLTFAQVPSPRMQSYHPFHLHHLLLGACFAPISMTDVWHILSLILTQFYKLCLVNHDKHHRNQGFWQGHKLASDEPESELRSDSIVCSFWNATPNLLLAKTLGFLWSLAQLNLFHTQSFLITSNLVTCAYSGLLLLSPSPSCCTKSSTTLYHELP